jgi:hypothetical protein
MDNFSEFERPLAPQKDSGSIISHAWENYKHYWVCNIICCYCFRYSLISMLFPSATLE